MNYEEQLQRLITLSLDGIEKTATFLQAEIPEVIKQLLLWKFAFYFIGFLVAIVCWIVIGYLARQIIKNWEEYGEDNIFPRVCIIVPTFIVSMAFVNLTWLKIWIAPKIFLIEYAAKLIKG